MLWYMYFLRFAVLYIMDSIRQKSLHQEFTTELGHFPINSDLKFLVLVSPKISVKCWNYFAENPIVTTLIFNFTCKDFYRLLYIWYYCLIYSFINGKNKLIETIMRSIWWMTNETCWNSQFEFPWNKFQNRLGLDTNHKRIIQILNWCNITNRKKAITSFIISV